MANALNRMYLVVYIVGNNNTAVFCCGRYSVHHYEVAANKATDLCGAFAAVEELPSLLAGLIT